MCGAGTRWAYWVRTPRAREPACAGAALRQEMLLDRPAAGHGAVAVDLIHARVGDLTDLALGVLLPDHDVGPALGLDGRVYIVYPGEIVAVGSPVDIVNAPDVR